MARQGVNSSELPPPVGPFSHAVKTKGPIYLSGQVGQDPATGKLIGGDVTVQTQQIFNNIRKVLQAIDRDLSHVVKVNVYLTDMGDFKAMNDVFAGQFEQPYPARTTVAVAALPLGATVEIEIVAE
jgi:2-iminobutanoate/2-iminopropanoate deaminase